MAIQAVDATQPTGGLGKGLGIAAIICGGLGVCVPGLALIGLILGVVGLVTSAPGHKKLPGIGTGVSAGGFLLNVVLMVATLLPAIGSARAAAAMLQEQQQLSEIGQGYMAFATENKGRFPDHAADIEPYLINKSDSFIAPPAKPGDIPLVKTDEKPADPYVYGSFEYMPLTGISLDSASSDFIIAYSAKPTGVNNQFRVILYMDGSVTHVEQAEFERVQQETLDMIAQHKRR